MVWEVVMSGPKKAEAGSTSCTRPDEPTTWRLRATAGAREGLHHELHRGQQFSGGRVAGGEVSRGEGAVVDAQGETVTVEDVEDVPGAAYEGNISEMCTVSPGRA
jgi:hypothetical protein